MSHTEEQAKTMWCPLSRQLYSDTAANRNSDGGIMYGAKCVGGACMAWRWSRAKETKAYLDAVQQFMAETGENFNTATNKIYARLGSTFERTEGYCGSFGRPE